MMRRQRRLAHLVWLLLLVVVATLVALSVPSTPAARAAEQALRIDRVELEEDGSSRLVVTVPPGVDAGPAGFRVFEDGEPVEGLAVRAVTERAEASRVTLFVLVDVSGSTAGDAIVAAREAALLVARRATALGVEVGLIAFGDEARLLVQPTTQAAPLEGAISTLEAGGDTALYDAVLLAAQESVGRTGDSRLVLFTDGRDDGSTTPLALARDAVEFARVGLDAIVLRTENTDVASLDVLAAASRAGSVREVDAASGLSEAFATVVDDLPVVHELRWTSQRRGAELEVRVEYGSSELGLADQALVANPRRGLPSAPREVVQPATGMLGSLGRLFALGLFGLGLAAFLAVLFAPRDRRVGESLAAAIDPQDAVEAPHRWRPARRGEGDEQGAAPGAWERLASSAQKARDRRRRDEHADVDELAQLIDRAGWHLRPAEFQILRVAATAGAGIVLGGFTQSLFLGVVAAVAGFVAPTLLAKAAHQRRQDAFIEQMPDVLQLVSGSLKAGYGLVQALDLVVEESAPPISTEFRRVLNEHLLGLELEEALDAMADRIESEDLEWVVVSMNIQRRVGGNLAELLDIVSATLRERATVRRHIRSLSAEGRLSAVVLTVMPFLISGYVYTVNRPYISRLFTDSRGQVMLLVSALLMIVGGLWMRKLIDIDV